MAKDPRGLVQMTLFSQKKYGERTTYRIPALLYQPSESLFLAFVEQRSSPRDEDARFLMLKRGYREGVCVKWGHPVQLRTAGMPNHRTMNPCPVYDKNNDVIFLFFICVKTSVSEQCQLWGRRNAVRLGYITSHDGSRNWSTMTDLTEELMGDAEASKWATFAVGPGHGVQRSSGDLVIPAYAYHVYKSCFGLSFPWWVKPHCFSFYSSDGGQTWRRSELLKSLKTTECQVAEVTCQDNRKVLYCNARSLHQFRGVAYCTEDGHRFADYALCTQLSEQPLGCQGSVVSFFPSDQGQKEDPGGSRSPMDASPSSASPGRSNHTWLMFSHPTSRKKREDLGIYLNPSPMEQSSWLSPWILHKGPSGYSDLAVCDDGESPTFACIFECGESKEYEEIAFYIFTQEELMKNVFPVKPPTAKLTTKHLKESWKTG
ncbi:sialidase-3-like isoform X1 [Crotalus tigris]|uniref:sialidase-3-like isoform X1 n=2 Tax=Crotalus tigris TaxID=88082 RepID=UPI00192F734D|nr:sialidase-3-like isoform X1 [Crotalus tigris]